jgi:hypothetical protein
MRLNTALKLKTIDARLVASKYVLAFAWSKRRLTVKLHLIATPIVSKANTPFRLLIIKLGDGNNDEYQET